MGSSLIVEDLVSQDLLQGRVIFEAAYCSRTASTHRTCSTGFDS